VASSLDDRTFEDVHRFWPHSLLGESRVLAGHVRDARVGRDLLVGVAFGVALALIDVERATLRPWLGVERRTEEADFDGEKRAPRPNPVAAASVCRNR
jgi:hypothetical protein